MHSHVAHEANRRVVVKEALILTGNESNFFRCPRFRHMELCLKLLGKREAYQALPCSAVGIENEFGMWPSAPLPHWFENPAPLG